MTVAPNTLIELQNKLVANLHTTNLGIVGDQAHINTGGYHIGAASLRNAGMSGDYSLEFALDYNATHDYACAIDIGGSSSMLQTLGNLIVHALENKDPRVFNKVRGVNAAFDGQTIDRRYDTENPANPDDSNMQPSDDRDHLHLEVYRTLVLNQSVMDGIYSVLSGSSTHQEEDMTPDEHARLLRVQDDCDKMKYTIDHALMPLVIALAAGEKVEKAELDSIKAELDKHAKATP